MARTAGLFIVNFTLILSALSNPGLGNVFAIGRSRRSNDPGIPRERLCNFNEATRTYNATDLVLCMNELASTVLLQRNINSNRITDRAYQEPRQSYLAYPDYSMLPIGGASSNYFDDDMLASLLSGALPLSGLANLFDFSGVARPGFNFFNALSSIAQYDDLKCVPRLLCEVASGSSPGSLAYRQSSGFQDFGKNGLFRLLTAFDVGGTSPILAFGKAALLGYTNRGQPNMCYHEYPRCPRNQDQLIYYLNNHNGGFFRLFSGNRGGYYRPQQSPHRPYYKNPSNEVEYRIVGSKTDYLNSKNLLRSESDRTGTGKLTFTNSDIRDQDNRETNFFSETLRGRESSRLVFPKKDRQNHHQSNRIMKEFNVFSSMAVEDNDKKEPLQKNHKFFPQDFRNENINNEPPYVEDYNRKPRIELFNKKESLVHFPHDTVNRDKSTFTFFNNRKYH